MSVATLPEPADSGDGSLSTLDEDPTANLQLSITEVPPSWPASQNAREVVRESYQSRLAQYRLVVGGFVPNLEPILRWGRSSPTSPLTPSSPPMQNRRQSDPLDPIQEPEEENAKRGFFSAGSIKGSIVNIAQATLGAGALSLPKAFYYAGLIYSMILMLVLVVLAVMSITVIIKSLSISGKNTFEDMSKRAFGPWFTLFYEVNIILFCFGTAVGYLMTVGDIFSQVVLRVVGDPAGNEFLKLLTDPSCLVTLITVVILFPLSMVDKINELRYASLIGICCILTLVGVVIYVFCRNGTSPTLDSFEDAFNPKDSIMGCFKMLSLAIFAFCCQPNVPSIYVELERKSLNRMTRVGVRGMLLCFVVYACIGMSGFLAFGENTDGNIMKNLQPFLKDNDPVVILGFACMAFAVTMAYPLNIFPIRFSVETILFYHRPHLNTKFMRVLIAVFAVGLSLVGAIYIPSLNLVFEIVGATTGSFVCFIGPGMLFCKLNKSATGIFERSNAMAICLVVVGFLFLVLGTYSSIADIVDALRKPASNSMSS